MKIYGIVVAAGYSSRMGRLKALLPLGQRSVLERTVTALRDGGALDVFVVTGHEAERVAAAAQSCEAQVVHNPNFDSGMFSSIQAGVQALPKDCDAFFVLPVDIPLIRPCTIRALAMNFCERKAPVSIPCFQGQEGHPPLISATLIPAILAHGGTRGLRGVLSKFPHANLEMPDYGILHDLDTPDQYAWAKKRFTQREIPLPEEVTALWELAGTPHNTRKHCKAVAECACELAKWLNASRTAHDTVSPELIRAAALLHDVAKGQRSHERAGGTLLAGYGFLQISDIVGAHKDSFLPEHAPITEKELVFLADKITRGTERVTLAERYDATLERWAHDPEAVAAISARKARAQKLLQRFEHETGFCAHEQCASPS
ncbi:DVU_1551 family NTP transferase [Desulfobaculum bizertense]|uniref:HDIG domain-containing protein n=1 Tax=Desulfobaculum bizertense DSM 18034 TaxID=1121442 RepID=A0A1T4VPD1_9BACT|nr:NTP transferase domain-containing protein [Desulfobaculum bizertense]SKA66779.1 HDIG domain-containing protein [Desulfobaculum bizertense DSM 18034]